MPRWKPQWVGAGLGLEMIQVEDNYWMEGAGWSEESGSPQ